ncbi:beta-1,3-galactosyltransferase 9 [Anomaloglossus baeobatrachus]|uniref:beta-1,3-galactosyltransferase 9 n=1 Tax=Anomaloglossus baeobatrachus TaxID=238106 RepID=UPI003F4FD690
MQVFLCRLRTHQCCFILIVLFHALLFGTDLVEEYLLRSTPITYKEEKFEKLREQAQTLNLSLQSENISRSYVISSSGRCAGQNVFLLIAIFSSPENRIRRERIRQTWGQAMFLQRFGATPVFMLGRPQMEATQYSLLNESRLHQDLVQGRFLDPSNDTLKAVMMMEWVVAFCPDARFILKADESVFVNVESLSHYLRRVEVHTSEVYTGRVIHQARADRDPHSLSFVPTTSYSQTVYPDYCSGSAMVMSQAVTRRLYLVSVQVTVAVPSEVFIGLCAQQTGVLPLHSFRFSGTRHIRYNRCCYRIIFSSSGIGDDEMSAVWTDLSRGHRCSKLETYYGLVACKVWSYLDRIKYYFSEEEGSWSF